MIAQMIAGIAAAGMASLLFPGPLRVDLKLGGGTSISQGVFIEMFTTILLVFTVVMLAAVKHKATFLAPLGIGLALFVDHLAGAQEISPVSDLYLSRLLHWCRYEPSANFRACCY